MQSILVRLAVPAVAVMALAAGCQGGDDVAADDSADSVEVVRAVNTVDNFFSDANGWTLPSAYTTIRYQNVGYDLKSDVCGRKSDGVYCALDVRGAFVDATRWSNVFTDLNGWTFPQYYTTIQFPDLDGDRQADICGRGPNQQSSPAPGVFCAFSNGSSGFVNTTLWNSDFSDVNGWGNAQYYRTIRFPDLNGNGRADICGRGGAGVLCGLNNGSSFAAPTNWSGHFSDAAGWTQEKYYSTIAFPDLDGDGDADVCGRGPSGGNVRIWCGLSNGSTGFSTPTSWNSTFGTTSWDDVQYYSTIQFADVNGDGKDDMCGRGPGGGTGSTIGIWCALSTGTTFSAATLWTTTIGSSAWNTEKYYGTIRLGKGYVCGRGGAGIHCAFSNDSSFKYMILDSASESDALGWTDPKYYKTISVTPDFRIVARGPQGIRAGPASHDNVSIRTPAEADARRAALIEHIWGQPNINTNEGVDTVENLSINNVDGLLLPTGTSVRRFRFDMPTQTGGVIDGVADHYFPPNATRLVVLNPGHSCSYTQLYGQAAHLIAELLREGYGVLATFMPNKSPGACGGDDTHEELFLTANLPENGRHPYLYFLDPVRRSLNQAIFERQYSRVDMAGLSGGGWTTTMYAALDTRIKISVPIAGSEPFYMRPWQDTEQNNDVAKNNDFFGFPSPNGMVVTGYKDLYVLGGYGPGRRQIQVLNRQDNCCFNPNTFTGEGPVSWEQSLRSHELEIRRALSNMGPGSGSYRLEINEGIDSDVVAQTPGQPHGHEFSNATRTNVILGELNASYSPVGTSTASTSAYARRTNGNLWRNTSGTSWEDSGLAMVGTPAVLSGAISGTSVEIFYRNPSNSLTHARRDLAGWQLLTDVSGVIKSDPVAVSWGTGRVDIVTINSSHQLRHNWRSTSGTWSSEQIGTGTGFSLLATGQPALTTWGANRLDVFYRRIDATLGHAFTNSGSGTWTIETVPLGTPGGVFKNFPTATTTTNVLQVYVVGRDDLLYQVTQSSGGQWFTIDLSNSTQTHNVKVLGSPSAFRAAGGGTQTVHARMAQNLVMFQAVPGNPWTFTNFGTASTPLTTSPFGNSVGALIVDVGQNVWRRPTTGGAWFSHEGNVDR
jgi:hypothetical protein